MRSGDNMSSDDRTWSALGFAFELGYLIAIPIVVLAIGGRLLDRWLGTSPWLLLAGILLSLIVSSVLVTRKAHMIITEQGRGQGRVAENDSVRRE